MPGAPGRGRRALLHELRRSESDSGGIAGNLESSVHTSAVQRIRAIRSNPDVAQQSLASINRSLSPNLLPITTADYVDLIDWTARLTRGDKRGHIEATQPPILGKLGLTGRQWHQQVLATETSYWRAIGTAQSLIEKAAAIGQSWLKGIGVAQGRMRQEAA